MFSAQGQAQVFLATVYAGLAAGVAYDMLRLLRLSLGAGSAVTAVMDALFWVTAAALVAGAAALSGAEGLRLYLVLGAACGMLLWAAGLRRVIFALGRAAGKAANRLQAGKRNRNGELSGQGTDAKRRGRKTEDSAP